MSDIPMEPQRPEGMYLYLTRTPSLCVGCGQAANTFVDIASTQPQPLKPSPVTGSELVGSTRSPSESFRLISSLHIPYRQVFDYLVRQCLHPLFPTTTTVHSRELFRTTCDNGPQADQAILEE